MISYLGRHGAKQYIHGKPIKFGYKMWVAATCRGYCIQFMPYLGAESIIDLALALGGSVVNKLVSWTIFSPVLNFLNIKKKRKCI